jgi:RNA polymerase sigma factor (sigma-70 family)
VRLDPQLSAQDSRDDYDAQDRQTMARDAMALLDARDRQILALSLNEGLKPNEIAAKLGMSSALVRQRKCRALRAIVLFVSDDSPGYKARRLLRR